MSVAKAVSGELEDALEGAIRDSVGRDSNLRRSVVSTTETASHSELSLQRASSLSLSGIDEVVAELQLLRDHIAGEGERVRREIAEYASLSQSSLQSAKASSESLAQFKNILPQSKPH